MYFSHTLLGNGYEVAQSFTTGTDPGGYTLTSIDFRFRTAPHTDTPTVTLHTGSETGTKVADFTGPAALTANTTANYTFTPTTTVTLNASTEYWVMVKGGLVTTQWQSTSRNAEDSGHAAGWSISNGHSRRIASSSNPFTSRDKVQALSVKGTVNPPPSVLVSNVGQETDDTPGIVDKAQPFRTGANPAGYTVTSIGIQTAGGVNTSSAQFPAVTLRSGSATGTLVGTPAKPSSSPNSGLLTYTFQTPVPLDASTTYWVVTGPETSTLTWYVAASDATDAATASGWTIPGKGQHKPGTSFVDFTGNAYLEFRVRGVVANSPAAGAPSITAPNVFRVPAVLTADISSITDGNGVTNIVNTATYRWQRFAANGTTLEAANIGTGDTYTLTDADASKKLRVVVSFIDDDGYTEGPLTSAATAAITAAAECAAPSLTGGAAFIGGPRKLTIGYTGFAYGFSTPAGPSPAGDLDDSTFTTAGGSANGIFAIVVNSAQGLTFATHAGLSADDKRTLVLHVCGDKALRLSSSNRVGLTAYYIFSNSGVDWSGHAERMVYLSQDTAEPTFVEATVNGTSLVMTFSEELGAAASLANTAFTVKKGSGGATQTLSGSPSISGRTVTLTLATAVSATDTAVKVLYTKPTTGTANKIVDTFGNEAATFPADEDVGNLLADSIPPELAATDAAVLAADGLTLTLTHNEALKESSVPAASAFTVKATPAGGSEAEAALASSGGVTVSGSTVALTLATPIAHNDGSVKVRYDKPATGAVIEDATGNDAAGFPYRTVTNNSLVPRVSIRAVYPDASPLIARPAFEFTRSNAGAQPLTVMPSMTQTESYFDTTLAAAEFESNQTQVRSLVVYFHPTVVNGINTDGTVTITVVGGDDHLPALAPNNSATVQVKLPPTGPTIQVLHQQQAYTVDEDHGVLNVGLLFSAGIGVAEPRFNDISTGVSVVIAVLTRAGTATIAQDYRHISANASARPDGWEPTQDGGYEFIKYVDIEIYDDDEYEGDETFEVYFDGTPGAANVLVYSNQDATVTIRDNDTLELSSVAVTSTPTGGYYGATDTIEFTVTFNGNVTVDTTDGTPRLAFELGGRTRQATYTSGSASKELVFSYTVAATDLDDHDGISWGANALSLNGGTIKFTHSNAARRVNADLDHDAQGALPDQKVDTMKPSFFEASVNGTTLVITFSEELNTTAPGSSAFTGKKTPSGGSETDLTISSTAPTISGSTLTLTLASASAVTATDMDIKVTYTKPSTNPIKDLSGKEADGFPTGKDVINELADSTPPELATTDAAVLAADGLTLTLTYNEALKESSVPAASAFTVKATPAGGSEAEVALASSGGVTVSGSTVVLKPAVPIAHNDGSVKVRYDKPGTGAVIEDANGNDAAGFPYRTVPNNSTAPRVSIEAVYDDASSLIANPVFRVRRSNIGSTNLIVNVSRSQTANYVQSINSTIHILSGLTEKEFTVYLDYPGNTNGDLTFTVEEGSGYAPAIAPNNAATVEVKAPASGLPVTVRQAQTSWTVEEGGTVDVAVTFTLAPGLAEPRDSFTVYLDPSDELAERGDDYVAYTDPEPRATAESGGWQPVSGGEDADRDLRVRVHPGHRRRGE